MKEAIAYEIPSAHDEWSCPYCQECESCEGGGSEHLPKRWTLVGIGARCDDCGGEGLVCDCACHNGGVPGEH